MDEKPMHLEDLQKVQLDEIGTPTKAEPRR